MISAVIPTWNEARSLPVLLPLLAREVDEIVVADASSPDGTADVARALGAIVVPSDRGRGHQLNAGARAARGDTLWFLHADTTLTPGVGSALRAASAEWGCFATRVDSRDPRLRFTGRWMTLRAQRTGSCTGDMGIWTRRRLFEALGGFAPPPTLEDLDFSDRARRHSPWQVLGPPLGTSARRWEREGTTRTILRFWALRAQYRLRPLDPRSRDART